MTGRPRGQRSFEFETPFDELLLGAQQGKGPSFDELFGSLRQPVTAFVAARGASEPHDVVNEVFLGVFRNISTFSGDVTDFRAWVFRIARNKVADALRRSARQPLTRPLVDHDDIVGGHAEQEAITALGFGELRSVLDTLTADQREVLVLRMVSDLSLDRVAQIVDKPVGAVKQLQRRAVLRIRREISGEGVSQ